MVRPVTSSYSVHSFVVIELRDGWRPCIIYRFALKSSHALEGLCWVTDTHCIVQSVSVSWPECLSLCKASTFVFAVLAYVSPLSVHPQMKQKGGLNKWKWCKRKPNERKQVVSVTCPWHQHLKDIFISSTSLYNASFSCTFTFSDSLSILLSFPLTLQIFLWMDCVCERIRNKLVNEWQQWRGNLFLQAGLLN